MLATFLIEFGLAFYTIWRYKMNTVKRLAVTIMFALGTFQLAEYMLCGGLGLSNVEWARIGYASITLLPALGIHMITAIADKKKPLLIGAAYATCAAFVGYYLIIQNAFTGQTCYANYAVFHANSMITEPFAAYYYGWLMVGTYLAWDWGNKLPKKQKALRAMAAGYLVFILPTTTVNLIDPSTIKGIPSIMCGFAVLLAVIISVKVLPRTCEIAASCNLVNDLRKKIS